MNPPISFRPENPLNLPSDKLTVGCPVLDRFLRGGVPCGSVTEIAGESGAGKTQLCLQLLLSSAAAAASLYIHSEFPFPLRRLRHLPAPDGRSNPLDHIFTRGVHSAEELLSLLAHADTLLTRRPSGLPIRLIVVDSIAALFRSEFDNNPADLKRRSSLFFKIAAKLKEQARRFNSAVVVTNQVVDVVGDEGGSGGLLVGNFESLWSSGRRVSPALGLSWANCVNMRLFLSRSDLVARKGGESIQSDDSDIDVITTRRMQLVFAPHLPESSCEFVIAREGVFGVNS